MSGLIGYVRKSPNGLDEEGMSIETQKSRIVAYCLANDLELHSIEEDLFQSSAHLDRPGIQKALASILDGTADGLVVCKLDRLTRSLRDLMDLLAGPFKTAALHSVSEKLDTSCATGRFFLAMMGAMAQWTRETIGENTKATLQAMQAAGAKLGKAPYGWRKVTGPDGKQTVVQQDPTEQAILAIIQGMRRQGHSQRVIAEWLNGKGFQTRYGKQWGHGTIQGILKGQT